MSGNPVPRSLWTIRRYLRFNLQTMGHGEDVGWADLGFRYADLGAAAGEAYERVLLDVLRGRSTFFWRNDGIEAAWRAIAPMLNLNLVDPALFPNYEPGTWGPASNALWHTVWHTETRGSPSHAPENDPTAANGLWSRTYTPEDEHERMSLLFRRSA